MIVLSSRSRTAVLITAFVLAHPSVQAYAQLPRATDRFATLANEFVFTTLVFSPSSATQAGLHRYTDPRTGRTLLLDQMLDDYSPAAMTASTRS